MVVIHNADLVNEQRVIVEGHIQPESGFFEVDTPIYEGDLVEVKDPRGGTRTLYAAAVNQFQGGSSMINHTEVKWGPRPNLARVDSPVNQVHHTYNAPVVIINGDQAQVAWDGGTNNRTDQIPPEFVQLAASVAEALELLSREGVVDPEDATIAEEVGRDLLEEMTQSAPEPRKIRSGLATLRGLLATVSGAAGTGLATGSIEELVKLLVTA